jgi:DNA-binding protein YbaB
MELQEVEVLIEKDGRVRIEVHGVKGMSCLEITKDLLDALGGEIESQELTSEAHATVQEDVQDQQRLQDGLE